MTICAIKVCRNYTGRRKTQKKVTYHRIPIDPVQRSRWIDIIRKSRGEDAWTPAKTTVVCSDHFHSKSKYFVTKNGRRRLSVGTVPSKALFLSSVKSDESEGSDEDTELKSDNDGVKDTYEESALDLSSVKSNESGESDDEMIIAEPSSYVKAAEKNMQDEAGMVSERDPLGEYKETKLITSAINEDKVASGSKDLEDTSYKNETGQYNIEDNDEDYSDLDSVYDSPIKAKLRKELKKKVLLQKKYQLKIKSLQRKNMRLNKKNCSLKRIIQRLKSEKKIQND